ncbi:MAG: rRNA maturation RNase YbeY [Eggerthellaceae bacterium]|nr:rRNA maturation RNase YbeY [Eggerthellaceae bacterium]
MDIQFNYEYREDELAGLSLGELAQFVLEHEKCPANTEVSISFVDNQRIAALNEEYRGIVGPTDVLSFECDGVEDDAGFSAINMEGDSVYELGDIIIAPDVAESQCAEYGNTFIQELSLLLTHGLLHLCGYDHMTDDEAEVMEAREKALLSEWFKVEFDR